MKQSRRADLILALGLVALGVVMLSGISEISFGAGYDRIGPRFFPYVVATGLIVLGLAFGVSRWQHAGRVVRSVLADDAVQPKLNARSLIHVGLGLLVLLLLMERAGFVIASSLQFWLVARGFHSRRPMRDAVVAVVLAAAVYVTFSRGLGLTLPSGVFESAN